MALDKAMKEIYKTSKSLGNELKSVNRLLKFDPKNTQLLAQKQELLNEQIGNTSKKLDALKQHKKKLRKSSRSLEISEPRNNRDFQRTLSKNRAGFKILYSATWKS